MEVKYIDSNLGFAYLIVALYKDKYKMIFYNSYFIADNKRKVLIQNSKSLFNIYMCKIPKFLMKNSNLEYNKIYVIKYVDNLNL